MKSLKWIAGILAIWFVIINLMILIPGFNVLIEAKHTENTVLDTPTYPERYPSLPTKLSEDDKVRASQVAVYASQKEAYQAYATSYQAYLTAYNAFVSFTTTGKSRQAA